MRQNDVIYSFINLQIAFLLLARDRVTLIEKFALYFRLSTLSVLCPYMRNPHCPHTSVYIHKIKNHNQMEKKPQQHFFLISKRKTCKIQDADAYMQLPIEV